MQLKQLLRSLSKYQLLGNINQEITTITNHSGEVIPGALFVCIPGLKLDGHNFGSLARARGAVALVVERDVDVDCTKIFVPDARLAQAWLSHKFYGDPSNLVEVIGVTGTNGKTTTTYFIESILNTFGLNAGRIGTINYKYNNQVFPSKQTTPDSIVLNKILGEMVCSGTKSIVIEVSSHGLAQNRVAACNFDVGIMSNITHDHLDFHKDYQSYLESKAILFEYLGRGGYNKPQLKFAVANLDDPSFDFMASRSAVPVISYSVNKSCELRASDIELRSNGSAFNITIKGRKHRFHLKLPGMFNIYNALASIAYAFGRNMDMDGVRKALEEVQGVPGRCQRIEEGQDFEVIVDFAHNPDGLKNILSYIPKTPGTRRILVFGCEGGKDKTKREIMGCIAGMLADFSIITMDNLFSEKPMEVARQIEKGLQSAGRLNGRDYVIILDRMQAIKEAISMAESNDQVIIAGKGHETTQTIYKQVKPFCDWDVAMVAIKMRLEDEQVNQQYSYYDISQSQPEYR